MTIQTLFTKRKLSGLLILLMGVYIAFVQIDCYYNQTLTATQQKTMTVSTVFLILMGTFYLMPQMNSIKEFFTKDIMTGLFNILSGLYIIWIVIDCYYEQTLTMQQINGMGVIGFFLILLGYCSLMREPKAT